MNSEIDCQPIYQGEAIAVRSRHTCVLQARAEQLVLGVTIRNRLMRTDLSDV